MPCYLQCGSSITYLWESNKTEISELLYSKYRFPNMDATQTNQSNKIRSKTIFSKYLFFFQAEDGIRDHCVTGVQTCALPI